MGVCAGLAALDRDAAVRIRAGHVCGEVQTEELIPERGIVEYVAKEAGADSKYLLEAGQILRELVLITLHPFRLSRLGE